MRENARSFLAHEGTVPTRFSSSEIRSSWQRCFDIGLDPFGHPEQIQISATALKNRREEKGLVRRQAKLEMKNLHRQIAGSNFIIIFADSDGVILDRIVDGSIATNNPGRTLPDFIWQEEINGTNALGMVAVSRKPAIVHGGEHYFKAYADLTCAAAPILGRNRELAGIIDATSDCRSRQRHTLALVAMSCITIENGLFRDRHKDNFIFELHNRREFLGTLQSAMLAFNEDGYLEESNGRARLYLPDLPVGVKIHFDEIFRTPFRELKGLLTRLLITFESGRVCAEDIQKILSVPPADTAAETQTKNLADRELEIIRAAYERNSGNISAIARELGISRNTVYKKLKEARKIRLDV